MKFDPFLSDEPSVAPPTPAAALVRLSQVIGALGAAAPNANVMPSMAEKLACARKNLLSAIEMGEKLSGPFAAAQHEIRSLYAQIVTDNPDEDARGEALMQLGFPDSRLAAAERVLPVDVSTVVATHFKPEKQVFTTLAFNESHGATAYWLLEVTYFKDERIVEGIVENYAPQFSRIRVPVGPHHFIIESRNAHYTARTEEFTVDIPRL